MSINKLLNTARNEIGYLEKKTNNDLDSKTGNAGSNNYTKYARDLDAIDGFYNGKKNGYPWCDVFVDWCFVESFGVNKALELTCQPLKSAGAGTVYSAQYYKKKGQYGQEPKAGAQIFFTRANGKIYHTGIVEKVEGNYVYTIEGNTSSKSGVVHNGGAVERKRYLTKNKAIAGYGYPKYDNIVQEDVKPNTYPKYEGGTNSIVTALNSLGIVSSYSNRKKIALANGISNYEGTAEQNTKLLKLLKNGELKVAGNEQVKPSKPVTLYYKRYTGTSNSIVTALKAIGVSSTYANRKAIAQRNSIVPYTGSASQNIKMLKLLKAGVLRK